jgi:hypothetical protein
METSHDWTPQEKAYVMLNLGKASYEAIGEQLGRSEAAVQRLVYRKDKHHDQWIRRIGNYEDAARGYARRCQGYSTQDIADILGVYPSVIMLWVHKGYIKPKKTKVNKRTYWSFSGHDLLTALQKQYLALSPAIKPGDPYWQEAINDIRMELKQRYISIADLKDLLGYAPGTDTIRILKDLTPAFTLSNRNGGRWYHRLEVFAWLQDHTNYWTPKTKQHFVDFLV